MQPGTDRTPGLYTMYTFDRRNAVLGVPSLFCGWIVWVTTAGPHWSNRAWKRLKIDGRISITIFSPLSQSINALVRDYPWWVLKKTPASLPWQSANPFWLAHSPANMPEVSEQVKQAVNIRALFAIVRGTLESQAVSLPVRGHSPYWNASESEASEFLGKASESETEIHLADGAHCSAVCAPTGSSRSECLSLFITYGSISKNSRLKKCSRTISFRNVRFDE